LNSGIIINLIIEAMTSNVLFELILIHVYNQGINIKKYKLINLNSLTKWKESQI